MPRVSKRNYTHRHTPTHLSTWRANTWSWVWIPRIHVKNPNTSSVRLWPQPWRRLGSRERRSPGGHWPVGQTNQWLQVKWKTLSQKIRGEGSSKETNINLRVPHSWAYICTEHIYNSKNNNNNNSQVRSVSSELLLTIEFLLLCPILHTLKHSLLDTGHGHGSMGAHNASDSPWHTLCRPRTLTHGTHCSFAQCPQASCSSFS